MFSYPVGGQLFPNPQPLIREPQVELLRNGAFSVSLQGLIFLVPSVALFVLSLSGPEGSCHSSGQHHKDVHSENLNFVQFLSWILVLLKAANFRGVEFLCS